MMLRPIKKEEVTCAIDDEALDCVELKSTPEPEPYVGVPAPVIAPYDPWFEPPIITEKGQEYLDQHKNNVNTEQHNNFTSNITTVEVDNIHEVMYQMATNGGNTTTQLDPMPELGGGSEMFQSGPGGWNSGTGFAQFKN
jgi:hypothetical protein